MLGLEDDVSRLSRFSFSSVSPSASASPSVFSSVGSADGLSSPPTSLLATDDAVLVKGGCAAVESAVLATVLRLVLEPPVLSVNAASLGLEPAVDDDVVDELDVVDALALGAVTLIRAASWLRDGSLDPPDFAGVALEDVALDLGAVLDIAEQDEQRGKFSSALRPITEPGR